MLRLISEKWVYPIETVTNDRSGISAEKSQYAELFGWMIINPGNMTTTHIPQMTPAMILGVCGSDSR